MKSAVIQLNAQADKAHNIRRAVWLVEKAIKNKAKLIVLPEVFNFRGRLTSDFLMAIAENIPGPSSQPFAVLAKRHRVFILLGSIYERWPKSRKVFNTSVLINDRGRITATYRKIHLFDAVIGSKVIRESNLFLAGEKLARAKVGGFSVGMSVCYDLRFPELFRRYGSLGCEVLTIPSSFTKKTGQSHWEVLLRARAIENLCYVLAPSQFGLDGKGVETYGNSLIIDPWGRVLAKASPNKEEVIYADLDHAAIDEARMILPNVRKMKI